MMQKLKAWIALPGRYFFWGSFFFVLFSQYVISGQMTDRRGFANSELRQDVVERWGAPIHQSAPSVRYVESGTVFNSLEPLEIESQTVRVDAEMSYRKRGLVYFSGFEFGFEGDYIVTNPEPYDIDIVFVFPVKFARRSMLKDLSFSVNGAPEALPFAENEERLSWTGRLTSGESASFLIRFRGRGLDAFTYTLDPEMPVRNFDFKIDITGGDNFDYAQGVVPATYTEVSDGEIHLGWKFASLEAGFPYGVILPSERSFDSVLLTMARRSWATFILFFGALVCLGLYHNRPIERIEAYLAGAGYAFFYVLLPYLAAYMNFYLAYAVTVLVIGGLLLLYLVRTLGSESLRSVLAAVVGTLLLPTLAVVFQQHTGLLYSILILIGLAVLMFLSTQPGFRSVLAQFEPTLETPVTPKEEVNVL
jgi:hypothetical protein